MLTIKKTNKLFVRLSDMTLEIIVVNKHVLRVVRFKGEHEPQENSFTVLKGQPDFTDWHHEENESGIKVFTSAVIAEYSFSDDRIVFYDRISGGVILEEKKEGASLLPDGAVEQIFESPDDEVLSGLGQQQDGAIDYKGRFAHLAQFNTVIAVPVMISSKGYGVFWDNPSLTEINGDKAEIPLEFNPYSKTWSAEWIPEETGKHTFVFQKLDKDMGFSISSMKINGDLLLNKATSWHANYITGQIELQKGKKYQIIISGVAKLYVQPPSIRSYTRIWSEVGNRIDYYFIYGPENDSIVREYRKLTGDVPMFGKWVFGYWQFRERYKTGDELLEVVKGYRKRGYPLDSIVQDWQYWKEYGWNAMKVHPDYTPDIEKLVDEVHGLNAHMMISVWPNFGEKPPSEAYVRFSEQGYLLDDTPLINMIDDYISTYQGYQRFFVDFFNEDALDEYCDLILKNLFSKGMDGWWLDGNEPGLSGLQGCFHLYETKAGPAKNVFNVYSLLQTKKLYEKQRKACDKKRVYMFSRSGFAGQQHYGTAVWSGDTYATWEAYQKQVVGGINYCMSGLPYWCSNTGGFAGASNEDPEYQELYIRWFQFSAFCPIFIAHGSGSKREVWEFEAETEKILVDYIRLRYRLLPYIYSVAWMVTRDHYTMLRSLSFDFANDINVFKIDDQYMFGPAIMVCPVVIEGARERDVYLPECSGWYDYWTGSFYEGGKYVTTDAPKEKLPLFIKAGSIIFEGDNIEYTDQKPLDPLYVHVYSGDDARMTLYEDEGDSYRYENGEYTEIVFSWDDREKSLSISDRKGSYDGMIENRKINIKVINSQGENIEAVLEYQGQAQSVCFIDDLKQ